jgi:nicotinate-nucleotide pyrophosphorylase (carboxylating)
VPDPNALSLPALFEHLASTGLIRRLLELAADEDLGRLCERDAKGSHAPEAYAGDLTSEVCIDPSTRATAHVVARKPGTIAGLAALPLLLDIFTTDVHARDLIVDGTQASQGQVLATLSGPLDELLTLERTLLNLVGRLSGVATQTRRHANAIPRGARAKLYDTRKTTPGLRVLEKYAVRCGGGHSHRMGLFDAVLIKDNHIAGLSPGELPAYVSAASARARELAKGTLQFVMCEVDSLEQLDALLNLPPNTLDIVLLDNMAVHQLREAARRRDVRAPKLELEASGGVTLDTLPDIATTGVDRISVGALTHSAVQLDIALDMVA